MILTTLNLRSLALTRRMVPMRSLCRLTQRLHTPLVLLLVVGWAYRVTEGSIIARQASSKHGLSAFQLALGPFVVQVSPPPVTLPDPIHYGRYCGPTPELNTHSNCRHPLDLRSMDATDEICRLHDTFYCHCDKYNQETGGKGPSSVVMAMRSSLPFNHQIMSKLDKRFYRCIHDADELMLNRFDSMIEKGSLPDAKWDPLTKWKFVNLLNVFRQNMVLDSRELDLTTASVDAAQVDGMTSIVDFEEASASLSSSAGSKVETAKPLQSINVMGIQRVNAAALPVGNTPSAASP